MNLIDQLRSLFRKDSQGRIQLSIQRVGQPVATPANYASFAKEGYQKNAVVNRCISLIAKNAAGISWEVYRKSGSREIELTEHPLLTLMNRPNPMMGWSQFYEAVISYFTISGNSYIESIGPENNKPPMELWPLRPDLMKIVPNERGFPGKYIFSSGGNSKVWENDWITGKSPILHTKTFHPTDIWYGMSPMEAALLNVDQVNQSNRWNLALLQNSASPSGVLAVKTSDANPSGSITDEQYRRLKEEFEHAHTSARNAGRPLILEGGIEWQSISLSPKEMEWLAGRKTTAQDICNVFGVPSIMLGFGDTTYNNYNEARTAFYEDTIIPLMNFFQYELNNWLVPMFGDDIVLKYDKDDIEPLNEKRASRYSSLASANWLTVNEKRNVSGFEPLPGWDVLIIGNQILANPEELNSIEPLDTMEGGDDNGEETSSESETSEEDNSETSTEEEINSEEDDAEKSYKIFNPINKIEISTSWKRVNARRQRLERPFSKMLEEDFKELSREIEKAAKSTQDARLLEYAIQKAIDNSLPDIKRTLKRYIKFTVDEFGEDVFTKAKSQRILLETKKNERTWKYWAEKFIETRTGNAIKEIEGTTRKQVRRVVQDLVAQNLLAQETEVDIAGELREKFDSLSSGRARAIARTETNVASNNATLEAVKSLEIPGMQKIWVHSSGDHERDGGDSGDLPNHVAMDGIAVDLDEKFTVPPDAEMDGPGDASAEPGQIINCKCTLIYKAK